MPQQQMHNSFLTSFYYSFQQDFLPTTVLIEASIASSVGINDSVDGDTALSLFYIKFIKENGAELRCCVM
jgi:hypothetical protein